MAGPVASRRITRGDVTAILQAFGGGGRVILQHSRVLEGAPADASIRGSIRPFAGSEWDGAHFCAEDWHVILIADIEGGDRSFTRSDAERIMDGLTVNFTLDGSALSSERTGISRFLDAGSFGLDEAYYFQQGRLMPPTDLSVGQHDLQVDVIDSTGAQTGHDGITFFIDAPGTGACTS
jgi:hypothetical protein